METGQKSIKTSLFNCPLLVMKTSKTVVCLQTKVNLLTLMGFGFQMHIKMGLICIVPLGTNIEKQMCSFSLCRPRALYKILHNLSRLNRTKVL